MSVLPTFLVAGACAVAIAYVVHREWRIMRREDREWESELAAAEREDARLVRRDARLGSLEQLWQLPARDPRRTAR